MAGSVGVSYAQSASALPCSEEYGRAYTHRPTGGDGSEKGGGVSQRDASRPHDCAASYLEVLQFDCHFLSRSHVSSCRWVTGWVTVSRVSARATERRFQSITQVDITEGTTPDLSAQVVVSADLQCTLGHG